MRYATPATVAACAALLLLLCPIGEAADDVKARLSAPFVYDDGTVEVIVEIGEVEGEAVGLTLTAPKDFRVEGPYGGARRTTVVNGVTRSVMEVGFRLRPPSGAAGEFDVGPVVLAKKSGRKVEFPVGRLRVGRRPKRGLRFSVSAEPPAGPVLMPFRAHYRILYSGQVHEDADVFGSARNPLGLTSLTIPALKRSDVKVRPAPAAGAAAATVRLENMSVPVHTGFAEVNGEIWRTIELTFEFTPLAIAEIDLSAEVGMSLVEGVEKRRDFFGRIVEVPSSRERRAKTAAVSYRVEELPAEGRPAGFEGAVGRFTIEVDPQPREVSAFDPIEVTVTIRGRGILERLSLPRWSSYAEITRDFELDRDVDPGVIEGDAKVFKVIFRARSGAVTRLPALPFPYYDPWEGRYEVSRSAPVPLTVRDIKTVRPDEAVGAPATGGATPPPGPIGRLRGIGANYLELDGGSGRLQAEPPLFGAGFLLLLLGPPLFAAAYLLLAHLRSRPGDAPRGTPLSRALAGLAGEPSIDGAAGAFTGYLRERLELPEGELTPGEVERALVARSVEAGVVGRVGAAYRELIAARFSGGDRPPTELSEVLQEADRCFG